MATVIDLSNLGSRGFVLRGESAGDLAGYSVASAGDVNGDGFDDIIVGAPWYQLDGYSRGKAYVVYGKAEGFSDLALRRLRPADGIALLGERPDHDIWTDRPYEQAGTSVATAGDVNGDGIDDLIVGAPGHYDLKGAAYVVYGKAEGLQSLTLGILSPEHGFTISGGWSATALGFAVAAAGDVNADGLGDIIVSAPNADGSGFDYWAGRTYVIFGKVGGYDGFSPGDLTPSTGFTIVGDSSNDGSGNSVASAGDVNGDGFADVIVGAMYGDDGGESAGEAYVIFGHAGGFGVAGVVDLTGLTADVGFVVQGGSAGDGLGVSVAAAGDLNGDGYGDIIVGASGDAGGGDQAGAAYVLWGKAGGFGARIDLNTLAPADGFVIQGDQAGDFAGWSVSSAGDINGDGFDDIIVGAKLGDKGDADAGAAYVVYGRATGFGSRLDLTDLSDTDGFTIRGDRAGDQAGYSVASAGDINGDGFDDLIVGAPHGDDIAEDAGEAYVIFGVAPTEAVHRTGTAVANTIHGGFGDDVLDGRGGDDVLLGAEGDDELKGQGGNDDLDGEEGNDKLIGDVGDDLMHGGDGNDRLSGSRGADSFYGGAGTDTLSGGTGADVFHFSKGGTSADAKTADRIVDFHQVEHDLLDLSDYDANPATKKVTDPFTFIGASAFSGAVGELRYQFDGGDTLLSGDLTGDRVADFIVKLTGSIALTRADFLFAAPAAPVIAAHAFLTHPDMTANPLLHLA